MKKFPVFLFNIFALICLPAGAVSADIVIDGYTHATNDRFTNSGLFIANQFDLSGVGQSVASDINQTTNWVTAVSRNVVVSAWHYQPTIGENVYFYETNDPSGPFQVRHVVARQRLGNGNGTTDIFIGVLNRPLPTSYKTYSFASTFLSGTASSNTQIILNDAGPWQDLNAYVFGRSPFNPSLDPNDDRWNYNDQAIGRNRITGYAENVVFNSNTDADALIFLHDISTSPDFVPFEAKLRGGDSGGPMFVDINGELVLLGTNAFLLGGDTGSGVNYLGNYSPEIQSYILANAIPEPAGLTLLALLVAASVHRSRRA